MELFNNNITINFTLDEWIKLLSNNMNQIKQFRLFCDCSLIAHLVKNEIPSLIQLHNYPISSNIEQKRNNWTTFQRKVLEKLCIKISQEDIERIIQVKHGKQRLLSLLSDLSEMIYNYKMNNNNSSKLTLDSNQNEETKVNPKISFYCGILNEKDKEIEDLNKLIKERLNRLQALNVEKGKLLLEKNKYENSLN